ncbi:hypothetical protein D9619_011389 [Psilocybe cf. subviscida]|uniref:RRM domain-containing protein n=1 Tax=Psilocybe cf. subviscida TaxID=2480587 RepID=A0A8H5F564_9AGAR|nr:hypothetical protein D9619_011389 [Psilocybe cf. subviscida]
MTGRKRIVQSGRSASHIHSHTPAQGRPNSRLQPITTHKPHTARLDMSNDPHSDGNPKPLQGESGGDHPAHPPANPPLAGKFGASPTAPSFAAVVSASHTATKPPLTSTPFSTLNQQQQQQEHAHSQSSLGYTNSGLDSGHITTSDNTPSTATLAPKSSNNNHSFGTANQHHHSSLRVSKNAANSAPPSGTVDLDDAGRDLEQENELEDSESSDVEIYLNNRGLHDSVARMHALVNAGDASSNGQAHSGHHQTVPQDQNHSPTRTNFQHKQEINSSALGADMMSNAFSGLRIGNSSTPNANAGDANAPKSLSPLPPSISPPSSFLQPQQGRAAQSTSPQLPQAPVQGTIPLPQVEEYDHNADHARRLQDLQHQQDLHNLNNNSNNYHTGHEQRPHPILQGGAIDLTGLSIGASGGGLQSPTSGHHHDAQQQQTISLGLPSSQSHPIFSSSSAGLDHGAGMLSPGGSSAFPTSVSDSGMAMTSGGAQKTANVYINGLPPHFPEDQLFALASPYGEVRSVRTFTRHVRDSESGYGFVLFEDIDSAERCINNLRKYRNLHPTYSKQIHKIPGTSYAQSVMPSPTSPWGQDDHGSGSSSAGASTADLSAEASFKAKMESLQDPTSTNLYMEGLPLSIDEPTLSALVSPHRIISSRFFQTRLSNPPRIIAFVRLETRFGAEEIIERLHGRMVRGWNDTGSRISVRFADTSEQRELRRTERTAQEGDGSPARLTIAQAALLNLRGQDLRPGQSTGPVIHAHSAVGSRVSSGSLQRNGLASSLSVPDFATNAHAAAQESLNVDYTLAPSRLPNSRSRSPYHAQGLGYQQETFSGHAQLGHTPPPSSMDPAMAALLNSLNNNGAPYQGTATPGYTPEELGYGLHGQQQQHSLGHGVHHLSTSQSVDNLHQYARAAPAYTRSGYTATEEYIMRAHAESAALAQAQVQAQLDRRRPAPLDFSRRRSEEENGLANIAVGVRGYRAQASLGRVGHGMMSPSTTNASLGSVSSPMAGGLGGDDFQTSSASLGRNDLRQQYRGLNSAGPVDGTGDGDYGRQNVAPQRHNPNLHPPHVNARLSRDPSTTSGSMYQHSPSLTSPSMEQQQESPNLNDAINNYQHAAAHMRSTTLPQHRSSSVRDSQRGHYQHSSMSMPAQNLRTPQHASVTQMGGAGGIEGVHGGSSTIYENEAQEEAGARHQQQQPVLLSRNNGHTGSSQGTQNVIGTVAPGGANAKAHYSNPGNMYADMESASSSPPSLISPTLTYGTQTPSTLSPATPFFGSFNSQSEGFEKGTNGPSGLEHKPQRKTSSTTLNSSSLNPASLRNQ